MKKIDKKWRKIAAVAFLVFFVSAAVFVLPETSFASTFGWGDQQEGFENRSGMSSTDPRIIIARIIRVVLGFLGVIAVGLIMYAGFIYTTSKGEADKIGKAKDILKNAIIGLIIILSAFAVATFILNALIRASSGSGSGGGIGPGGWIGGYGAIGGCAIVNYYPTIGQRDVPRNASIMVTFREEVDMSTVYDPATGAVEESVRLFLRRDRESCILQDIDNCPSLVTGLRATSTADGLSIVFMPSQYLGSADERMEYGFYLSGDIENTEGDGVFRNCGDSYAYWNFEVNTRLDLEPPQVKENGVFPFPDDSQDDVISSDGVQASGEITVNAVPRIERSAAIATGGLITGTAGGSALTASATVAASCAEEMLHISVANDLSSQLRRGDASGLLLGAGRINSSGDRIDFDFCGISLVLDSVRFADQCGGTCLWSVDILPRVESSLVIIGDAAYSFVDGAGDRDYEVPLTLPTDPASIADALASRISLTSRQATAVAAGNVVTITARAAGVVGNGIAIATTENTAFGLSGDHLTGGVNRGYAVTRNGAEDQPRNTIIKIDFDDEMMPIAISGDAEDVDGSIMVECFAGDGCNNLDASSYFACDANGDSNPAERCLHGKFVVSNQFRTVEFKSNNRCGTNTCGEDIFCLPGNSQLRVAVVAAALDGCTNGCNGRAPYDTCNAGHCYSSADSRYYPLSAGLAGTMDKARNSLDGNRDTGAVGPVSFYQEGLSNNTTGDSYEWLFFISDRLETTIPAIDSISPSIGEDIDDDPNAPISFAFSRVMLPSSLRSGDMKISNSDGETVKHKLVNIWNSADFPIGYWVESSDIYDMGPAHTQAYIRHTDFLDNSNYRSQAGSGIKDIYQNCFKPSDGPDTGGGLCGTDLGNPSCCDGAATSTLGERGDCFR